jgi:starvation-inducible DNA-binding protein
MSVQRQPGQCGAATSPTAPAAPTAQPILNQRSKSIQNFGTVLAYPIALPEAARKANVAALNQMLADSIYLRDLHRKSEWQVVGATFRQMAHLFHKHYKMMDHLVGKLGKRVQTLGGVTVAVPHDVVDMAKIERPPIDREELPVQISRLIEGHEKIIEQCRALAKLAEGNGDEGTEELITDHVLRRHEKAVWHLAAHLTDTPLVCATK